MPSNHSSLSTLVTAGYPIWSNFIKRGSKRISCSIRWMLWEYRSVCRKTSQTWNKRRTSKTRKSKKVKSIICLLMSNYKAKMLCLISRIPNVTTKQLLRLGKLSKVQSLQDKIPQCQFSNHQHKLKQAPNRLAVKTRSWLNKKWTTTLLIKPNPQLTRKCKHQNRLRTKKQ